MSRGVSLAHQRARFRWCIIVEVLDTVFDKQNYAIVLPNSAHCALRSILFWRNKSQLPGHSCLAAVEDDFGNAVRPSLV